MIIIDHLGMGVFNSYVTIRKISNKTIFLGILFSVICDIDLMWSGSAGSLAYLKYHRVWSHSLVVIAPLILSVTILSCNIRIRCFQGINTKEILLIQVLGFFSHITLDILTPYGVPLFYPLSNYRCSVDLLHDFDPVTSLMSIAALVVILIVGKKRYDHKVIAIILIGYCGYLSFVIANKNLHRHLFAGQFREPDTLQIDVIPKTFWRWKGLINSDGKLILLNSVSEAETLTVLTDSMVYNDFKNNEILRIFLNYARYPAISKLNDSTFQCYNLAYSKLNYRLTIEVDSCHVIQSYETTSFDLIDK